MKTHTFDVLGPQEIQQIHAASMEVLETIGIKVDYEIARKIFAKAGAKVDETHRGGAHPRSAGDAGDRQSSQKLPVVRRGWQVQRSGRWR